MKRRVALIASAILAAAVAAGPSALAATCQVSACTAALEAADGLLVNDIFRDANKRTAQNLTVYGKLVNNWPGCPENIDFAGAGQSVGPFDCPGEYQGIGTTATVANANSFLGAVDRRFWQPCRLDDPTIVNGCVKSWACIADGTGGNYNPWQGLVFDLGGPSNKVVLFGENDHGPQPCESLEYTVFLSDNPTAQAQILRPQIDGIDPMKWNRAALSRVYTHGWIDVRPPDQTGHGSSCGDTDAYSVEEDSFVQVFSLPCGITLRYAAVVAGNDGVDFSACAYDSNEGEIDAVAGLSESGAGVCPDNDHDHYVDCNCPGAPPVCDCNDGDATIHPGAHEACDSPDLDCDGMPGSCAGGLACHEGACLATCSVGANPFCPAGSTCTATADGDLCIPKDCNCTAGQVCIDDVCVSACQGVHCPGTQVCQAGNCIDPCAKVLCPEGQVCQGGECVSPCSCYAGDLGCGAPDVCDNGTSGSNTCVDPMCKGVVCADGETCDASTGTCIDFCNSGVQCPAGQKCVAPDGCVPMCSGVTCPLNLSCDPSTGTCVDTACANVTCVAPLVCVSGACITPDGGTPIDAGSTSSSTASRSTGATSSGAASSSTASSSTGAASSGAASSSTASSSTGATSSGASSSTGSQSSSSGTGGGGSIPDQQGSCGCRAVGEDAEAPLSTACGLALLGSAIAIARRKRRLHATLVLPRRLQ